MKKTIISILGLLFMFSLNAQNKTIDSKPKGMEFIPTGSVKMKMAWAPEPKMVTFTVDAYWMSNEITNAEFREFVDWANKNPDKYLYQIKFLREVVTDPKNSVTKDTMILKKIPIKVSTFNSNMIDPLCLEKENKDYKGYFTDKKFDDYPIVGVSFKLAEYFCIWKTMLENERRKELGLPNIHAYRIPLEQEWEYVAQAPVSTKDNNDTTSKIQKVSEGATNDLGLFHLNDNVSEWVITNPGHIGAIRGGSFRSKNNIANQSLINEDSQDPYIGFRIVQSYVPTK